MADLDRAERFYTTVLGMDVAAREPTPRERLVPAASALRQPPRPWPVRE
ncbi:VOC family protein [Arthrobacter sp. MDT3-24]